MRFREFIKEDGRIVKGVNTTVDVGTDEIKTQAAKFGNTVDKDGRPPTLSKKVKGSSTNVLFNLGLAEGYKLQLERDREMLVLHIKDTATGKRTEVRGKPGYETNYDPNDSLHKLLDKVGKSANISELMNGEVVSINPKHPDADRAKAATDKAYSETYTRDQLPQIKNSQLKNIKHTLETIDIDNIIPVQQERIIKNFKRQVDNIVAGKYKPIIVDCDNKIINGHHRYTALQMLEYKEIQVARLSWTLEQILENFADGRAENKLREALGEIGSASEIYVDMDGVLADFFGEWARLMDVDHFTDINKQHDINDALQKIRDTDDFWLKLPMLPEAKNLLNLIKQVKGEYYICTSPLADDPNSEKHKRTWIEQNLAFFPPKEVYVTHNKPQYATNEDGTPNILIDDYGVNINNWEAAGGIGFKYKDHKFERTAKAIKQHMQEPVEENFTENKINFTMPNFNFEWEEANRYEQYRKIGKEEWIKLAKTGKVVDVDNRMANDIENTEAGEEYRDDHWDGLVQAKRDRFAKALSSGQIELPIIARYSDGQLELISGNTRLTGMMRELGKAKAWIYDVPDEIADLEENFADGKKKGKSRPGRVKRSGASCNGSVTALRKRAKNASGEKAKMLHWCANMKSGRKKNK